MQKRLPTIGGVLLIMDITHSVRHESQALLVMSVTRPAPAQQQPAAWKAELVHAASDRRFTRDFGPITHAASDN